MAETVLSRFLRVSGQDFDSIDRQLQRTQVAPEVVATAVPKRVLAAQKDISMVQLPELRLNPKALKFSSSVNISPQELDQLFATNPVINLPKEAQHYKVAMHVRVDLLGLTTREVDVLAQLVRNRYDPVTRQMKLVCDRFRNRVENRKYLVFLLQNLVLEVKELAQSAIVGKPEL